MTTTPAAEPAQIVCACIAHLDTMALARAAWDEDCQWHTAPEYGFDRLSRAAQARWCAVAIATVRAAVCVCEEAA